MMIYRKLPTSDIKLSAISFGGMRFIDSDKIDTCAELVVKAYEKGINYFDTAPGYPRSEEIFGVAIDQMKKTREEKPFYCATKTMQTRPDKIKKEIETSLKRMGVDRIDFYFVWCVMSFDDYLDRKKKGVLKTFESLKEQGLIKHICISTHATGPQIAEILKDFPFEAVLLGYSAMNFSYRQEAIEAASELGRAVFIMNPLGGGLIPQNPERFEFVKTRSDENVAQAALRFLINDSRITSVLVGLSTAEQLDEAISAVDGFLPIKPQIIEKIRNGLQNSFNELCTTCRYCDNCPEGINVPGMMDVFNQSILSDKPIDLINRYRYHWGIGLEDNYLQKCTRCRLCERACTQKLPICDRLDSIKERIADFLEAEKRKEESR